MEAQIGKYSYLLGLGVAVAAVIWRLLAMFGMAPKVVLFSSAHGLSYRVLLQGCLLLLLITVASAARAFLRTKEIE